MPESDVFERRLRAALDRYVEGGPTDFDAAGFARMVSTAEPRRRRYPLALTWSPSLQLAWLLLITGLVLALAAGVLLVGSQTRRPAITGSAGAAAELVATSRAEAWAIRNGTLWYVGDGDWYQVATGVETSDGGLRGVARAPDGSLWVAGDGGVATYHDRWTVVDRQRARAIAFGRDGTVWIGGDTLVALRSEDDAWTRATIAGPRLDPPGIASLAIDGHGNVWATTLGTWKEPGSLARLQGSTWQIVRPREDSQDLVTDIEASEGGDLWVSLYDGRCRLARFDGRSWTLYGEDDGVPSDMLGGLAIAPDGEVWMPTERGLVRFDGRHWTTLHQARWFSAVAFAPDGAIWVVAQGGSGFQRLEEIPD